MALSGSFRQTFSNNGAHDLIVEWSAKQNVGGNYSDVTAKLFLKGNYSWSTIYSGSVKKAVSITIDGTRSPIGHATTNISGTQKKELMSWTKRVNHGSNGKKSFSISAIVDIQLSWNGRYEKSYATSSRSFTLNTIPRASSLSGVTSSLDYGQALKFTINAADGSFRHTLHLNVPGYSGNILTDQTGGAKSYTTKKSWASGIPNATSGRGTLKLLTYSGSTKIGEKSYGLTIRVPGDIIPTISSIGHSEGNSKVSSVMAGNGYVQGISKVDFSISSSSSHGASIKGSEITVSGRTVSGNSIDLNTLSGVAGNSVPVIVKVIDSRGRIAQKTENIKILPYSAPRITSFSAQRTKGTNNVQVIRSGSVSSLKVGTVEKNTYTAKIEIQENGSTQWTTKHTTSGAIGNVNLTEVDRTKSYLVRTVVADKFNTSISQVSISTERTLLHLHRDEGVGIGKMREKGVLDIEGDVYIDEGTLYTDEDRFASRKQAALNLRNGDLVGVNGIYIGYNAFGNPDPATPNNGEGLYFPHSQTKLPIYDHGHVVNVDSASQITGWDNFTVLDGRAYINKTMVLGMRQENVTVNSGYTPYSTSGPNKPIVTRIGQIVTLSGALKNISKIEIDQFPQTVGRVPTWARPNARAHTLQQGSGNLIFFLAIDVDGTIVIDRMRAGNDKISSAAGQWLNIGITYVTTED